MIKREKVGLAFTQQIGSSTRGTRFDFRFPARSTYSELLLAVRTSYLAAPDSGFLLVVVVRELSATITRHKSNKQSTHKYKLNLLIYKTNKDG